MTKYTWDKKLLWQLYKNPHIREELIGLLTSYLGPFDFYNGLHNSLKDTLKIDLEFLGNNPFISQVLDDLVEKHPYSIDSNQLLPKRFNKDDIFNMAISFYSSLDDVFYNVFKKLYDQRYTHFRFTSSLNSNLFTGSTFHSYEADETFIVSEYNKTFASTMSLIYEYAHAISFALTKEKPILPQEDLFREVESLFIEIIALQFFESNYPHLSEDIKIFRQKAYHCFLLDAMTLDYKLIINNIIKDQGQDFLDNNSNTIRRFIQKYLDLSSWQIRDICKMPASVVGTYPISTLVAIELYDIYIQNPKEAFKIYMKIIDFPYKENWELYEELKKMDITPSSHIESFERMLIKN